MRVSLESDYEIESQFRNSPFKQFYAAIINRAIDDIASLDPWVDRQKKDPTSRKKQYKKVVMPVCFYSAAMAWIFNEKDMKEPPIVSFSYCCEALNIDPETIQRHCAQIILKKKTPAPGTKLVLREKLED